MKLAFLLLYSKNIQLELGLHVAFKERATKCPLSDFFLRILCLQLYRILEEKRKIKSGRGHVFDSRR
jgi:hypothetical protein